MVSESGIMSKMSSLRKIGLEKSLAFGLDDSFSCGKALTFYYVCVWVCVSEWVYVCMYVCMYYICTYMHAYMHTLMHDYIMCMHVYMCMCVCMCADAYLCIRYEPNAALTLRYANLIYWDKRLLLVGLLHLTCLQLYIVWQQTCYSNLKSRENSNACRIQAYDL